MPFLTPGFHRIMRGTALVAAVAIAPAASGLPAGWILDKPQSHLTFETVVVGQDIAGSFGRWDARIVLDPKKLADAAMHVTVDVASVTSGNEERDTALPSETWFDVSHFAAATFDSRSIRQVKPGEYEAAGTLTMRGISKPLVLPFRFDISGRTAHMTSTVEINRTDFGIGSGEFVTGDTVAVEVTIKVDLTATRGD